MCGIVAVVGKIGANEERAFKMLLEIDTIRGPHSTGVLSVTRTGSTEISKSVGTPWDLYDSKRFESMFNSRTHSVLLGHNRYATRGSVTSKNAHPFEHGDIIGVHNGTLTQQSLLEDHRKFDVDSDNLYYHMNIYGVDDTVNKLDGAFALAWYDKADGSFNMTRNTERPLSYTLSEDGLTCFVASEAWMLSVVLSKHTIKHGDIINIKPGEFHYFNVTTETAQKDMKPIQIYWRDLEQYKKKVYQAPAYTGSTGTNGTGNGKGTTTTTNTGGTVTSIEDARNKKNAIGPLGVLSDYTGQYVDVSAVCKVKGGHGRHKYTYIKCETDDDNGVKVRVYCTDNTKLMNMLMNSKNLFRVKISGFNTYGNQGFLCVQQGSITEIHNTAERKGEEKEESKESDLLALPNPDVHYSDANYIGHNGRALTYDQFRYAVRNGCCCCADPMEMKDKDKIEWVTPEEYVCVGCLNSKDSAMQAVIEMARTELH